MTRRASFWTPVVVRTIPLLVLAIASAGLVSAGPASATTRLETPTNARALNAGSGKAVITWDGIYGATKFRVTYGTSSTFTSGSGAVAIETTGPKTHLVLTGLKAGTTYYFHLRALSSDSRLASSYTSTKSFKTLADGSLSDFGIMSYNILCADYCVESSRHNIDTFPWLKRRARLVSDISSSRLVDIIGLQEAGGYVATGWNCRTSPTSCSTPIKLTPDGTDGAYDRFCSVADCPGRVEGGKFGGTPRQIDDVMRFLPGFGITAIAGDPNAKETGFSYLRIMWRTATFDLVREGTTFDIDGDQYEAKLNWHRKAYWAVLRQKSTGRDYF
ncbi:MAG: fibronectin type III domain-containing protein, partial [Aeromicrobium sp.]